MTRGPLHQLVPTPSAAALGAQAVRGADADLARNLLCLLRMNHAATATSRAGELDVSAPFFSILRLGACLFASVPPQLRDAHARDLQESLAARLAGERGLRGLLLDVSSLGIVDSYAAKVLGEIGASARSLGARAILVGLRPAVAVTLVELGIDLSHVETAMSLEKALGLLRMRLVTED